MASLEFPNRSVDNTNTVNTSQNASSDKKQNSAKAEKQHQELMKKLESINKGVSKGLGLVAEQTEEVAGEVTEQVFGSGLFVRKLKEGVTGLFKSIKNITSKSVENLIGFFKLDADLRHYKLAKIIVNLKHGLLAPFKYVNKALKSIDKGITWLSETMVTGVGKTLKYILIGAGVFIKWLKNFLLKSMLFKAIGSLGKMALNGVTAAVSLGGNLVSSIATKLVSSSVVGLFKSAVTKMLGGLTAGALIAAIASLIVGAWKTGKGIYEGLTNPERFENQAETAQAMSNALDYETASQVAKARGVPVEEVLAEYEEKNRRLSEKNEKLLDEAAKVRQYDEWTKQYRDLMLKVLPDSFWSFSRDRNDDGIKDYTADRYETARKAILETVSESDLIKQYNSIRESEELKNKSILKNTAGVSST